MCCNLRPERPVEPKEDGSNALLAGSLVSSLHRLKDQDNQGRLRQAPHRLTLLTLNTEGAYFVFGDISVKVIGRHRLVFNLFDLRR